MCLLSYFQISNVSAIEKMGFEVGEVVSIMMNSLAHQVLFCCCICCVNHLRCSTQGSFMLILIPVCQSVNDAVLHLRQHVCQTKTRKTEPTAGMQT
jgi:hypothetical protein